MTTVLDPRLHPSLSHLEEVSLACMFGGHASVHVFISRFVMEGACNLHSSPNRILAENCGALLWYMQAGRFDCGLRLSIPGKGVKDKRQHLQHRINLAILQAQKL